MRFVSWSDVVERIRGKTVAVVGGGPGCLDNAPGFIDGHEIVVRINGYKTGRAQGFRCDVHGSFYGTSIRKTAEELLRDGVKLCLCKCPNGKPLESEWHERNGKQIGIDFRYIYRNRAAWWFGDTFIPSTEAFLEKFALLGKHIPTTGFAAILDVLACEPRSLYLTGFDGFTSGLHNVDEKWRQGDPSDPIGHRPALEAAWLAENVRRYPLTFDARLTAILGERVAA